MTTPDFHPYLREGDLRTPEDVRDFVASFGNSAFTGEVLRALDDRLDRERRQACRRAALREWRHAINYVRSARAHRNSDNVWWACGPTIYSAVRECLAFRKEARKP